MGDPAGFSENGNVAAYRRAELKHGRVCMQAALGIIVSEKFHPIFDAWGEGPYVSAVEGIGKQGAQQWPAGNGFRCWHDRTGAGYGQEHLLMAIRIYFSSSSTPNVSTWHLEVVVFHFRS